MAKSIVKRTFLSYARNDEFYFRSFKKDLIKHSSHMPLQWNVWDDTKIPAGKQWHFIIQQEIQKCDFALLLVSGNFLSSKYVNEQELKVLLMRNYRDRFFIFPVLIEPCNYLQHKELASLQFFRCHGADSGLPNVPELTYADLVTITKQGEVLANPNRDRCFLSLLSKIGDVLG